MDSPFVKNLSTSKFPGTSSPRETENTKRGVSPVLLFVEDPQRVGCGSSLNHITECYFFLYSVL